MHFLLFNSYFFFILILIIFFASNILLHNQKNNSTIKELKITKVIQDNNNEKVYGVETYFSLLDLYISIYSTT